MSTAERLSLDEAIARCRGLGWEVKIKRAHGEYKIRLPSGRYLCINRRNKDAPPVLMSQLRRAQEG